MSISSILFICLGNICRSPLAQGVFEDRIASTSLAGKIHIDSAGTGSWHVGNKPDARSIQTAATHGIDITAQKCRQLCADDFHDFDLILGMDHSNLSNARRANHTNGAAKIELFCEFAGIGDIEIPDPYYGGTDGFEIAYKLIRQASDGVLHRLCADPIH